jgi:hypothetical protein
MRNPAAIARATDRASNHERAPRANADDGNEHNLPTGSPRRAQPRTSTRIEMNRSPHQTGIASLHLARDVTDEVRSAPLGRSSLQSAQGKDLGVTSEMLVAAAERVCRDRVLTSPARLTRRCRLTPEALRPAHRRTQSVLPMRRQGRATCPGRCRVVSLGESRGRTGAPGRRSHVASMRGGPMLSESS